MSVFTTRVGPPSFSIFRTLAFSAVLTGAFLLARPDSPSTANVSDALLVATQTPTATVFPEPVTVQWEGYVTRSLAGGRGLEVRSSEADTGYFFAYDDNGFPASASQGTVRVHGQWIGISCEYGRCAPEVEAESVESIAIELE